MSDGNVLRVTGCFIHIEDKFLILHRLPNKSQGGLWGLPAGKIDADEEPIEAVIREIYEETGIELPRMETELFDHHTWHFPEKSVEFISFKHHLKTPAEVTISPNEHQDYKWVTPQECYNRNDLIHGLHDLLERVKYI